MTVSPPRSNCDDFPQALHFAKDGAASGFEWLFARFGRPVKAFTVAQGQSGHDADDITSEVFAAAFRSISSFTGTEDNFVAWLFRIARNKMIDGARRSARRPQEASLGDLVPHASSNVEAEVVGDLLSGRVLGMLDTLTGDQREVLVLRFVSDLSIEQAAQVMGKSAGAVKQLQHRALARVKRTIEQGAVT